MAKKKVAGVVKIQIPAGQATPAPPVGTALGPHGVAIMDFCKAYNAATENQRGTIVPVDITIFEDRSSPSSSRPRPPRCCCARRPGSRRAPACPVAEIVGSITDAQVAEIAQIKMPDLNANDLDGRQAPGRRHRTDHGNPSQVATHR